MSIDLILKVSQNTSLRKAHRTCIFSNNIDKIIMTLGNYSPKFNSRMHQMQFRVKKTCLNFAFKLKLLLTSHHDAQTVIKNIHCLPFSLGLQQIIFCIAPKYTVSVTVKTLCALAFLSQKVRLS